MKRRTRKRRQRLEYVGTLVDHDGSPVVPGSPAWAKLSEQVSAVWGAAIAWRRDHRPEDRQDTTAS